MPLTFYNKVLLYIIIFFIYNADIYHHTAHDIMYDLSKYSVTFYQVMDTSRINFINRYLFYILYKIQ